MAVLLLPCPLQVTAACPSSPVGPHGQRRGALLTDTLQSGTGQKGGGVALCIWHIWQGCSLAGLLGGVFQKARRPFVTVCVLACI